MGNILGGCYSSGGKKAKRRPAASSSRRFSVGAAPSAANGHGSSSGRWTKIRSSRRERGGGEEEEAAALSHEQAIAAAAAILGLQRDGLGSGLPFDRSASTRYPGGSKRQQQQQQLPRSSSSRARSLTDPLLPPQQLVNQDLKIEELESDHFLLVHGGGFGAWCWYKTITLLEEGGFKVDAIDLTGSGVDSVNANSISSLSQYAKPLTDYLEKIVDGKKVVLVGHDFGGACISYALEKFPSKIAKAIFISASMLRSGQSTLDMFSHKAGQSDLMRAAQIFVYANGNDQPPTAIDLDKSLLRDLLFNQSPAKDVALASVSMRPIPFAPVLEKLTLSDVNYGSVRRFYIETPEDNAIPLSLQQVMIEASPPERVFRLKGSDHSPFFSKPQALHKLLVEIAKIPSTPAR